MAQKDFTKMKALIVGLRQAVSGLPTESEKQEILARCTELVEFLNDLQKRLQAVPSADDMVGTNRAIQTLEELFAKASASPTLAAIVGIKQPRPPRQRLGLPTVEENSTAKEALEHLETLPIDAIRSELQSEEKYSLRQVQVVGLLLGVKSTKGISRDALVHQIATKVSNYRGDRILRGQAEEKPQ